MQTRIKKAVTFTLVLFLVYSTSFFPHVNGETSDSWTIIKSMQVARSYPSVAVVNDKVYAIGGDSILQIGEYEWHTALNVTEEYDPERDTWVFKKDMLTSRYQFAVAVYHGLIFCIGGTTDDGVTAVNEVYNPTTDTWQTRASMPTPRMNIQANIVGGKIYIISTGATQVYDPETDTWTTKTVCPNRITSGASAVADDKIYFLATYDSKLDLGAFVQVYDPKNDVWTKAGPAPSYGTSAATAPVAVGLGESEKIVFFQYDSTLIYFPRNDSWVQGTPVSGSRGYAGVTLLNGEYCVVGGIVLPFAFTMAASSVATAQMYVPNENMPIDADTTIYIRPDGSIEPSSANITTTDKVTYAFTDNNFERMIIERDNIIIDGNGYTLQGMSGVYASKQMSYGISIYQRQNVTIANTIILGFGTAGIALEASTNNHIIGTYIRIKMNNGIRFYSGASNNTIKNNDISNIIFYECANNNIASSNKLGYVGCYASGNIITGNNLTGGTCVSFVHATNNTLSYNKIENCIQNGVNLRENSNYNIISSNFIKNTIIGLNVDNSSNNYIYHNNFVDNKVNCKVVLSQNVWDNGFNGNYWDNYNGTDNNGDLVGDTPYHISKNNIDDFPLMAPITVFDAGTWEWTPYEISVISNSTVFDFVFNRSLKRISFCVEDGNQTTGFCRVSIPKDFLSAEKNWLVLLDNNSVNTTVTTDSKNTYIDINYVADSTASVIEIQGNVVIPEFQNFNVLLILVVFTLVAFVLFKKPLKRTGSLPGNTIT